MKDDILDIRNRTENWKTAYHLSRFIHTKDSSPLAKAIIEADGEATKALGAVRLELFWKGFRDYWHQTDENDGRPTKERLLKICHELFGDLRGDNAWQHSRLHLDDSSYVFDGKVATDKLKVTADKLFDNLRNTEIDIVLECSGYLLIGEAKDEADFGADASHVLCHQLVRQFIMASVVVELTKPGIKVVPFIVTSQKEKTKRAGQAQLMMTRGHLKEGNILAWDEVDKLK